MSELINKLAAINLPVIPKADREYISFNLDDVYEQGWNECQNHIAQIPAAEPEIIRCKDCKYHQKWRSEEAARKFGQAYTCEKNILYCPKPEDFCSCAARKIDTQPKTGEWICGKN